MTANTRLVTFLSSHFKRFALQVIHPVLLFRCLGFVLGAFRMLPGVGWMGSFPGAFIPS